MKTRWEYLEFEDCIDKIVYTNKIKRKDFLVKGEYRIISQEENYINGYWNAESELFKIIKPVVIFGDHTKNLKYIDFDFVLGADGVKIFQPIDCIINPAIKDLTLYSILDILIFKIRFNTIWEFLNFSHV